MASAVQLMLISILVSFYLGHLIPDHLIPVQILVYTPIVGQHLKLAKRKVSLGLGVLFPLDGGIGEG